MFAWSFLLRQTWVLIWFLVESFDPASNPRGSSGQPVSMTPKIHETLKAQDMTPAPGLTLSQLQALVRDVVSSTPV